MRNSPLKKFQAHAYFNNHLRIALESLKRLYIEPTATMMTAAVIAIALALPLGLYVGLNNIGQLSHGWDSSTKISLFLHTHVKQVTAKKLAQQLKKNHAIKDITIISKNEGLEQFKETSGFGDAIKYLDVNPLPIVLVVQPKTDYNQPEKITELVSKLGKIKLVELAQLDAQWVKRLYSFLQIAHRSIWIISFMFAIAVLLIIGNTIRLDIQNRRDEIEVSKLIGASDAFIQRPFLYAGFWYGLIGGVLAWLAIQISLFFMSSPIHDLALLYDSDFRLNSLSLADTALLTVVSCGLGLLGSWIAVIHHLKDIEPC